MLSEAAGDTTTPLLDETIHENLARTAAARPDGDAPSVNDLIDYQAFCGVA